MGLIIAFLTLVIVLTSLFLILLILIQLPKKEAGAGLAFGGAATDALFGAGSGTVLSRITKYATGVFLVTALMLSILQVHQAKVSGRGLMKELDNKAAAGATTQKPAAPPAQPVPALQTPPPAQQALTTTLTNVPVAAPVQTRTNPPAEAPK